jgi:hypothetical protein
MKRSILRQVLTVFGTCALYLPIAVFQSVPAQAAAVTFTDPNCDSFNFDVANQKLTCVVSSPPTCSVSGPTSGTLNSAITLIANCSPAATSWVWTQDVPGVGTICSASVSSTCQDIQTTAGTVHYQVTGSNANGPGPLSTPAQAVVWSAQAQPPTGCTISGAPGGSKPPGTMVTLTVNCTGGGGATSWSWTGSGAAGQVTQSVGPFAVNATTTFTATPCSSPGQCMTTPGVTVTISGGGGGGGSADCTPQGYPSTKNASFTWPTDGSVHQILPGDYGGMGPNDALVIKFTTPSSTTSSTGAGFINAIEYPSSSSPARSGSVSTVPCDFTGGAVEDKCGGATTAFANNGEPNVGLTYLQSRSCKLNLQPNTTYYFNIINTPGNVGCTVCDMLIQFQKPS